MNRPAILGALLLGVAGYAVAGCSSKNNTATTSTGGQSSTTGGSSASGASSSGGGSSAGGGNSSGGAPASGGAAPTGGVATGGTLPFACGHADASVTYNEEGGLARIGYTDPARSVTLGDGGHYVMPNTKYKGYCFTYADTGGSALYPPCGTTAGADGGFPPCFTASSGLCPSASLRPGSATAWGGGIGCNLNQAAGEGTAALFTDVIGMTSMTISVYGCAVPALLQVQLNVVNAPNDPDSGVPGSGYFCNRTTPLGAPDANGIRSATVQLTDLRQDCWITGDAGTASGPVFDPATMNVRSIQAQINAPEGAATNFDFCVSQWSIQ